MLQNNSRPDESGNVFLFILLGVVLFAALAFVISRGFRTDTTTAMSKRQIELAVSEILAYSQQTSRAVDKMRNRGSSENDICFWHSEQSTATKAIYIAQPGCSGDEQHIYGRDGGNLAFRTVPADFLDAAHDSEMGYGEWMFSTNNSVNGLGEGALNLPASSELITFIPHLKEELCAALNAKLGITDIPDNGNQFSPNPAPGNAYLAGGQIPEPEFEGKYAGCFHNTTTFNNFIFYQVLIERDVP